MELKDIFALLDRFDRSPAAVLELEMDKTRLRLEKGGVSLSAVPTTVPAPDMPAPADTGTILKKGQTVCVLEAMKMMSEVPAPCDCVIEEVLIENGDLAAFGAPLFRIKEL